MKDRIFTISNEDMDKVIHILSGVIFRRQSEDKSHWIVKFIPKYIKMVEASDMMSLFNEIK